MTPSSTARGAPWESTAPLAITRRDAAGRRYLRAERVPPKRHRIRVAIMRELDALLDDLSDEQIDRVLAEVTP